MVWTIASVPFWILGGVFFLGSFASIKWNQRTTDTEAGRFFGALVTSGVFFLIAATVAR